MTSHAASQAHHWFRSAGAPLIVPTRTRAEQTLARSAPLLAWMITSTILYLLLWGYLVTHTGGTSFASAGIDEVSDDVFLLILLALTFLPPLVFFFVPWWVARAQKKLPLWGQNLLGAALLPPSVYILSPHASRVLGATDIADLTNLHSAFLTVAVVVIGVFLGLDSLTLWVGRHIKSELLGLSSMIAKVLPVLMVAVLFFFVNGDIWRVADALSPARTLQVVGVLAMLSALVIISTVTGQTRRTLGARRGDRVEEYTYEEYEQAASQAGPQWLAALTDHKTQKGLISPPALGRSEWYNLISLPMVVQGIQALFFGLLVCLFFIWFGTIAIPDATVTGWLAHPGPAGELCGAYLAL